MSEEPMNDSNFGRLFIIMILAMTVLAIALGEIASIAASDVNAMLDERSEVENSGAIVTRLTPVGNFSAESAVVVPVEAKVLTGEEAYATCAACHASGIAGAPMVGSAPAWNDRLTQGIDTLYEHAIDGYQGAAGFMPAKGGNTALSDDSVKAAVDYMVEQLP